MVAARRQFLASNAYYPIADAMVALILEQQHQWQSRQNQQLVIADAGCGEGYYLRTIVKQLAVSQAVQALGWDISKFAVQAAAKQMPTGHFVTASNAHIPLSANSIDILLSAFGFPVAAEFARVVKRGGFVVTADNGERHLLELRHRIYPEIKAYRPKALLDETLFDCIEEQTLAYALTLNRQQLAQLLLMTPHFFRAKAERLAQVQSFPNLAVTVDVVLRCYRVR